MSTMTIPTNLPDDIRQWLAEKAEEDERLYAQHGKPLEVEHMGEYVAIAPDGRTILGKERLSVFQQALETFGKGNFGLFKVGSPAVYRWLTLCS